MLTAIVVGVATTALAFALIVRIKEAYDSVEEDDIFEKDDLCGEDADQW
jgi:multicomponent Na+:H+ antiporter subunit C